MDAISDLIAMHEDLTTPQSEDWQVIVDGGTAHVCALHEDTVNSLTLVSVMLFEWKMRDLKKRVLNPPKYSRPLGCITVYVCRDNKPACAKLVEWLLRAARKRPGFSVMVMPVPDTATDAIALQHALSMTPPPGWTVASEVRV